MALDSLPLIQSESLSTLILCLGVRDVRWKASAAGVRLLSATPAALPALSRPTITKLYGKEILVCVALAAPSLSSAVSGKFNVTILPMQPGLANGHVETQILRTGWISSSISMLNSSEGHAGRTSLKKRTHARRRDFSTKTYRATPMMHDGHG
jgi:hypothetical protein